jgi:hypothetical protein
MRIAVCPAIIAVLKKSVRHVASTVTGDYASDLWQEQ